jgi:hypothetical protein
MSDVHRGIQQAAGTEDYRTRSDIPINSRDSTARSLPFIARANFKNLHTSPLTVLIPF